MTVAPLNRSLDQELAALLRGVSFECLVCGEFVLHVQGSAGVPRVQVDPRGVGGADRRDRVTISGAGRVTAGAPFRRRARGKSGHRRAGRWARSARSGTQAAKADGKWNRKETAGR